MLRRPTGLVLPGGSGLDEAAAEDRLSGAQRLLRLRRHFGLDAAVLPEPRSTESERLHRLHLGHDGLAHVDLGVFSPSRNPRSDL